MKVVDKGQRKCRLLVSSDVHGYVYPYDYATQEEKPLGFAKLASLIKKYRDEHTLLIDNGDAFEGAPLAFHHFKYSQETPAPASLVMQAMRYDYLNLGNHDFNYGQEQLKKHLQTVQATCLTGNVHGLFDAEDAQTSPLGIIREINGIKLGLFGVVTHYIPQWEKVQNIQGLHFQDAFSYAQACVEFLRPQVDYVVGFYHGGFERDLVSDEPTEEQTGENQGSKMVKLLQGLDVLVTGHQHRSLFGQYKNVVITQTADKGKELAVIDFYEKGIESYLLEPTEPAQNDLLALVQEQEALCQQWLDAPLGKSKLDLWVQDEHQARFEKHPIVSFLNLVALQATGADLAGNALFNGAKGFKKEITVRDIVSTYVYPNTMFIKEVDRKLLKAYLEKNAEFFALDKEGKLMVNPRYVAPKPQYYNYDMVDGIAYTFDLRKPVGERVVSIVYQGEELAEDKKLSLAINNYRAGGGGDFLMMKEAKTLREISKGMVEMLIEYILEKGEIDFEPTQNIQLKY